MGKGFNNYMTKKFFHPSSKENIKRVWMAQQKTEFEKKKQEDLLNQYQKEQEMYQNRALLGDEKAKLGLSFMYDAPPGLKKKEEEKEGEAEVKFEWQRKYNAPREQYAKNDEEIRDQPFGIEVRNVRCIKCRKWGHVNTDKICPLFNTDLTAEPPQPSTSAASLLEGMKEDGFKLKQSILGRMAEDPTAEHEKILESGDEDDPEVKFLKSLSAKQKKKLLKKLNKLQEGKGKKSKKDKKQKKKKHRSSSSDSEDETPKRKKKKKKRSESDSENEMESRIKGKKKKYSSDSEYEDERQGKRMNREQDRSRDRNRSSSRQRGKQPQKMAHRKSSSSSPNRRQKSRHEPREHRRDSYKNGKHNKSKSESESSSDSENDYSDDRKRKFNDSRDNERSMKNRPRSRSHSPDNRQHYRSRQSKSHRSRSTSRDRSRHSKSHRSRSRDRGKRSSRSAERRPNRRHTRSRSRSRSKADKGRNRSRDHGSRSKYSSGSSRSRSGSGDRNHSALPRNGVRSSINTPPVKGWLTSAEVTPGVKDRLGKPRPTIWIVGSSIVYWAHRRASQLRNINLGIKTSDAGIEWYGTRGMRWNALLPKLQELSHTRSRPDILILYVGSNDVGYVKPKDLVSMIKTDMNRIKEMLPDTTLVYNEILSRINWRGAPNNQEGEEQRLTINKLVKPVMESYGGFMIHHPDICNINTSLYRDDGVHLNDMGYDIFNSNIENTIRAALLRMQY